MNKTKLLLLVIISVLLIVVFQLYESNQSSSNNINKIADPMTENILIAMNEDNYPQFSKDFDSQMKTMLNETVYQQKIPGIKSKIGQYQSKEFVSSKDKGGYTIVFYKAKFSQEPEEVIVQSILSQENGKYFISGFWLDSPNLRNK